MQDWRDAGKEGFMKGAMYSRKEECKKGEMQDRKDEGQEGFRTCVIQVMCDAGKEL